MAVTSYPNIVFNADTGANTEFSSGAGPGDGVTSGSALTGTNANTTINGTRVNLDGSPDLTNVATDGSHVIWLDTAMLTVANSTPNRTFSQINGKGNSGTSTAYVDVEDAYFNNLLNKKWSIGGKLDGALDHPSVKVLWGQANTTDTFGHVRGDGMIGWSYELEESTADYALSTGIVAKSFNVSGISSTIIAFCGTDEGGSNYPGGGITIYSKSTNNKPRITFNRADWAFHSVFGFTGDPIVRFENIKFSMLGTTEMARLFAVASSDSHLVVKNCVMDTYEDPNPPTNRFYGILDTANISGSSYTFMDCYFENIFEGVIPAGGQNASNARIINNYFKNVTRPIYVVRLITEIINNIFDTCGNTSDDSQSTILLDQDLSFGGRNSIIMNNTFYNSYGNDILLDGVERQGSVIINNLSVNCANTFLVIEDEIFNQEHGIYDYNMVVNPGNQSTLGVKNGLNLNFQNDVTGVSDALLVDPANRNFNLQSNSPAKGVGNDYIAEANTSSYPDIGASQSQEPQGGGIRQIIRPPIINIVPG